MYNIQCILYIVYYTLHIIHCLYIVYAIQRMVYSRNLLLVIKVGLLNVRNQVNHFNRLKIQNELHTGRERWPSVFAVGWHCTWQSGDRMILSGFHPGESNTRRKQDYQESIT